MTTTTTFFRTLPSITGLLLISQSLQAQEPNAAFLDRWALTIPGGGAGWLEVTKQDGYYDASILWGGGSVVPVDSVFFADSDTLIVTRISEVKRNPADAVDPPKVTENPSARSASQMPSSQRSMAMRCN